MNKFLKYGLSLSLAAATFGATANDVISDQQRTNAKALISEALESELAYSIVESLTTEIGARMGGSEAEARARKWGQELGNELGFDKVSIEQFKMPFWDRGDLSISLSKPYAQELYGTA